MVPLIKPATAGPPLNRLLAAFPPQTLTVLQPSLSHIVLVQGEVCFAAGDPIQRVYFPTSGLISLVIDMDQGDLVETGLVGREGAAGLQSAFGPRFSFTRAVVQMSGTFYAIAAEALRRAINDSEAARAVIEHYTELLWAEAQQVAACNALHPANSRLARWLLQAADRAGTEQLSLTQEFIGEMLGIRRTSVTLLAQDLQRRGVIKYSRGKIAILNRETLEGCACDCYGIVKGLYREVSMRSKATLRTVGA